jgi:DNA-directed RNA polymerase specialized sigma24 family protein
VTDPRPGFQSTLWTVILQAREGDSTNRREALGRLLEAYRGPLVAWLLGKGCSPDDTQDAVQGFFAYFLEKALVERADPTRGRFRNYLLKVFDPWLSNERRVARAGKRGGGRPTVSLVVDPGGHGTPEDAYNREWAMTVLARAQAELRREFEERGMASHYRAVCEHLSAVEDRPSYEDLASRLGVKPADVGALLFNSRRRLRELVKSVLRETVDTEAEVEPEVGDLFKFLVKK